MKRKYSVLLLIAIMVMLALMASGCGSEDTYTVTWKNYDGTVLETDVDVEYGSMPSYNGATPTKTAETHYTYEFSGWDSAIVAVSGNVTYTATFVQVANTYTITFVDGSETTEVSYKYGESITEPSDPSKDGYTFEGWYNGETLYDFNATVTGNLDLTAKWEAITYKVTFTDSEPTQTIGYDGKVTEPTNPSKDGYTFEGWYNGETLYDFNATVTGNLDLTAKWEAITYKVTFTDSEPTQTISYNGKVTEPTNPSKDGYMFVGWYNGETLYDFNTTVSGDLELTAKWQEIAAPTTHTVTINNVNGDDLIYKYNIETGSYLQDETAPTKENYTFVGYDVDGDSVVDYATLSLIKVTSNMTITAIYQIDQNKVTFYALDGETVLDEQVIDYGDTAVMPTGTNVVGYTFLNFAYDKENVSKFDFDTSIASSIELYAIYDKDPGVFVVTFYSDEQSADSNTVFATVQAKENESATMQGTPTKTGYTFVEWSGSYDSVTQDLYIYPIYEKLEYEVTFTYDSGDIIETQQVKYLESATMPTVIGIVGYTFSGFDCDDDGIVDELYNSVYGKITAVAIYLPNSITVNFDAGSGTLTSDSTSTIDYNTAVLTPSNPILAGSLFSHWSLEGSSTAYDFNTLVTEEITLVANYTKLVDMYTVVFYDEYGVQIGNVQVVAAGYNATLPGGYSTSGGYIGWDSNNDGIADTGYENIQDNMDIYALKESVISRASLMTMSMSVSSSYTVTFMVNNVEYHSAYVDSGAFVSIPTTPIVTGKVFEHWTLDGTAFDFDTAITSDITLVAKLDTIQEIYSVTFVDYDTSVIYVAEVCEGDDAVAPTNPTRYGYVFDAWQGSYNNVVADVTITATYNKASYDVIFYDQTNNIISTQQVEYLGDATAPQDLTLEGYNFVGWTNYTNITKNTGVFPIFEAIQYEVAFMYESGETISSIMVDYDSIVPYSVAPTVNNYIFVGWYIGEDMFDFGTTISGAIELTAKYTVLDYIKYEVVFYDADDEQFGGTQYIREGESAASPGKPYKAGYEFSGWSLSYDNVTQDLAIYPIFSEISYTVVFYDYNCNVVSTQTLLYGESADIPTLEVLEGYTFLYWSDNTSSVTKDMQVTPIYSKVQYLVSFIDSSGSYIGSPQYVYYGESAIAPTAPSIDGYTFISWSADFSSVVSHMVIMPVYEVTQVAPTEYNITSTSGNGGSVSVDKTVAQEGETIAITITAMVGYELESVIVTSGSTVITLNSDYTFVMPAGDVTITAVWAEITYNVSFSDGVASQTISYGGKVTEPSAPYKEGYTFEGWYNGETLYDFSATVTGDLTLTAQWTDITTTDPDDDTTYTDENTIVIESSSENGQTILTVSVMGEVEFAGMQMDIVVGGEVLSITTSTSGVVVSSDSENGTAHINFASSENVDSDITLATIVVNAVDIEKIEVINVIFVSLINGIVQEAEYHIEIK